MEKNKLEERINFMFASLNEERLKKKLGDITIVIDDHEFVCHRFVLMTMFHYFYSMFMYDYQEKNLPKIVITNEFVKSDVFNQILEFAYSGNAIITPDNVLSLCSAASYLNSPALLNDIEDYLKSILDCYNVFELYQTSLKYDFKSLQLDCMMFFYKNISTFQTNETFQSLSSKNLKEITTELSKAVTFKENIFSLILMWIKHDRVKRIRLVENLFEDFHFDNLSLPFFMKTIAEDEIFNGFERIKNIKNLHDQYKNNKKFLHLINKKYDFQTIPNSAFFPNSIGVTSTQAQTYSDKNGIWLSSPVEIKQNEGTLTEIKNDDKILYLNHPEHRNPVLIYNF